MLRENEMPDFVAAKWVEHGKDFVALEVYKKSQAELAKKISALQFEAQSDETRKKTNVDLVQGLIKDRLDREIKTTIIKRVEALE